MYEAGGIRISIYNRFRRRLRTYGCARKKEETKYKTNGLVNSGKDKEETNNSADSQQIVHNFVI